MASVATAGMAIGSMICQKMRSSPAPSMRAASSSSTGKVWKNWRSMKMPNAPTAPGRIKPQYELIQPMPP